MSFLGDIANALTLCETESKEFIEIFTNVIVKDSISEESEPRTVLLVESPDKDEICHGHPLAGKSGKAVTRKLLTNQHNTPIGCFLHRGCKCTQFDIQNAAISSLGLGLMNVSLLPLNMKSEVYCQNIHQQYSEFLCYLQAIKNNPCIDLLSDHAPSGVYKAIRDDLRRRLRRLSSNVLVVPCGKVARAFLCRVTHMSSDQGGPKIYVSDNDIPHPSRSYWARQKHKETIDSLLETIRDRANDN